VITEDVVRTLAGFDAARAPVTTCYLDVDGRRLPSHLDVQRAFDALVKRSRQRTNGHREHPSVQADLERMTKHVKGFSRSSAKGLAMFSCSQAGLWEVFELPVRVTDQLVVHTAPHVHQLEEIVDEYERFGVLLCDRQRARMFVYEMGELIEHTEVVDTIARHSDDDRGDHVKTRLDHQLAAQTQQHLRHAADLAFGVRQRHGFERLIVGGPVEVRGELEALLHPYLRERLAGHVAVAVNAPDDQIKKAAFEVEQQVERRNEATLVARLREAAGARTRGVVALGATLDALNAHRVDVLLVSSAYEAEGWRCPGCRALATVGRSCTACRGEMVHVVDVVEEAVEEALAQHCRVEVCVGNADLDVLGRIGALLRY
jgi:peptide subunit release factor 1 (eRF1)